MANHSLAFEKPVVELENKLQELRAFSEAQNIDVSAELAKLEKKSPRPNAISSRT